MAKYVMFTIMDADAGERFSTTDYGDEAGARRERNRLALTYGKTFALVVCGIDAAGALHEIDEDEAEAQGTGGQA